MSPMATSKNMASEQACCVVYCVISTALKYVQGVNSQGRTIGIGSINLACLQYPRGRECIEGTRPNYFQGISLYWIIPFYSACWGLFHFIQPAGDYSILFSLMVEYSISFSLLGELFHFIQPAS